MFAVDEATQTTLQSLAAAVERFIQAAVARVARIEAAIDAISRGLVLSHEATNGKKTYT